MIVIIVWVFLFVKKNNKCWFEVFFIFNLIFFDKKVLLIESNFIKEVIDKKIGFFLFWCCLIVVLFLVYVEIV